MAHVIGDRWGVTPAETRMRFGCDDLVTAPTLEAWRGVDVRAAPEVVWRRVRQLRLAPYSYDLVDNLARRSPRELRNVAEPRPGDPFTRAFGRDQGRVVDVDPGRELTATIMGAHLSYVVLPHADGARLLLKVVGSPPRPTTTLLCLGDLVMARKQLVTLAALAEQDSVRGTA